MRLFLCAQNKGMIALFSNSEIHQYLEKTELTEQETEAFEKAAGCWKYEGVFAEHMERLGSVWECPVNFHSPVSSSVICNSGIMLCIFCYIYIKLLKFTGFYCYCHIQRSSLYPIKVLPAFYLFIRIGNRPNPILLQFFHRFLELLAI